MDTLRKTIRQVKHLTHLHELEELESLIINLAIKDAVANDIMIIIDCWQTAFEYLEKRLTQENTL